MESHEPQPPHPVLDEEWDAYKGIMEKDMIPDYGIQIFTYIDTRGRRGYKWATVGDSTIEDVVTMLTRVGFLIQFRSEIVDIANLPDDEDEDD